MKKLVVLNVLLATFANQAHAVNGDGGIQFYEMVFGNPSQRNASRGHKDSHEVGNEACEGYGGLIGDINGFFCHMEKDMGITSPGSRTKSLGGLRVRAEILKVPTTIGGVTYAYTGSVWVCKSSSADCTLTTNFARAYYIAFSYDPLAGVNKGYALSDPGIFNGPGGNASEIIYDVGSASANQSVSGKMVFTDSGSGSTFKMRVVGQRTATAFQLNLAAFNTGASAGFRYAMAGTPPSAAGGARIYNMYYEGSGGSGTNGFYALDAAGLAAPATGNGFCGSVNETGTSSLVTASAGNCATNAFGAFDFTALTASSALSTSAQGLSAASIIGAWQGMAANPSAL